jgi:hypothetical protein
MLDQVIINEELIGEDFETTVRAYLARDVEHNLQPDDILSHSLRKLGYDGNKLWFLNGNFQNANLEVNHEILQDILVNNDVETFYRSLSLDALNYLGY